MMLKAAYIIFLSVVIISCKGRKEKSFATNDRLSSFSKAYNKVELKVERISLCQYPKQDPVYFKKANKKIVVFQVTVGPQAGAVRDDIVPHGAMLTDSRANQYEATPGAVAMAQNNKCIKGDDLKAYNQIWNGEIKEAESVTAFAVGFEIPTDAVMEKLYWNKKWIQAEEYILLNKNDFTANH